jgi:hypothetical protein
MPESTPRVKLTLDPYDDDDDDGGGGDGGDGGDGGGGGGNPIPATGISLNKTTLTLTTTETLVPQLTPSGATSLIVWSSSNPTVAIVDATTGLITAVQDGTTTITATANGHSATCVVTVNCGRMGTGTLTLAGGLYNPTTDSYPWGGGAVAASVSNGTVVYIEASGSLVNKTGTTFDNNKFSIAIASTDLPTLVPLNQLAVNNIFSAWTEPAVGGTVTANPSDANYVSIDVIVGIGGSSVGFTKGNITSSAIDIVRYYWVDKNVSITATGGESPVNPAVGPSHNFTLYLTMGWNAIHTRRIIASGEDYVDITNPNPTNYNWIKFLP